MRKFFAVALGAYAATAVWAQDAASESARGVEEEHHRSLSVAAMALCVAFVAAACISNVLERYKIQAYIPPSSVMIIAGMVLGDHYCLKLCHYHMEKQFRQHQCLQMCL